MDMLDFGAAQGEDLIRAMQTLLQSNFQLSTGTHQQVAYTCRKVIMPLRRESGDGGSNGSRR